MENKDRRRKTSKYKYIPTSPRSDVRYLASKLGGYFIASLYLLNLLISASSSLVLILDINDKEINLVPFIILPIFIIVVFKGVRVFKALCSELEKVNPELVKGIRGMKREAQNQGTQAIKEFKSSRNQGYSIPDISDESSYSSGNDDRYDAP